MDQTFALSRPRQNKQCFISSQQPQVHCTSAKLVHLERPQHQTNMERQERQERQEHQEEMESQERQEHQELQEDMEYQKDLEIDVFNPPKAKAISTTLGMQAN